jgi:hypothetical protein
MECVAGMRDKEITANRAPGFLRWRIFISNLLHTVR